MADLNKIQQARDMMYNDSIIPPVNFTLSKKSVRYEKNSHEWNALVRSKYMGAMYGADPMALTYDEYHQAAYVIVTIHVHMYSAIPNSSTTEHKYYDKKGKLVATRSVR